MGKRKVPPASPMNAQGICLPPHTHKNPRGLLAFPHIPTRTTVASAFSGIFSSSFSSCLDLERVMPAGGAGGCSSRWGHRTELTGGQYLLQVQHSTHWAGLPPLVPHPTRPLLTSLSTSIRASGIPPMRGSVTWGSPSAPWPWWWPSREPREPAEMLRGKEKSFSSLGWLVGMGLGNGW